MTFPEQIGSYRFHPPAEGETGWGISDKAGWLPIILADRDACVRVTELAQQYDDWLDWLRVLEELRDTYNRARPIVLVTREHIDAHLAGRER